MKIKKQTDIKDCGLVLIQALHHQYFKKWIPINILKQEAKYGSKGINISNMIDLSKRYGVLLEAFKVNFETLLTNSGGDWFITTITNEGENHYVLVKMSDKVTIIDPIKGKYKLTLEKFNSLYQGIVISIEEGVNEDREINIKTPFKFILKNPSIISWIFITIVITTIISLTSSVFMKIILDKVIPGALTKTLNVVTIGFVWLGFLKVSTSFLKNYMMSKLMLNVETIINLKYFEKMKKASVEDLTKVTTTDHIRRMSLIESVASFISNTLFVVFADILNFILATGLLIWISPKLFGFALVAAGLVALISLTTHMFVKGQYDPLIASGLTSMTSSLDVIYSTQDIKFTGVGEKLSNKQINDYYSFKRKGWTIWRLTGINSFISGLVHVIAPVIFVYVFVGEIFASKISVGTMIMFLSIFSIFISPVEDFALLAIKLKQNMKNVELLDFVLRFENEKLNINGLEMGKIKTLELKEVVFGYDKDLFKIDGWKIDENIHLKGNNGSGKSSLLNIISTKYKVKGDFIINGLEVDYISTSKYRESLFFAHPMSFFPKRTVFEYITNNEQEAIKEFNSNIMRFNLNRLFREMDIDLNKPIINNGANFSSGQKQMIQIMKLFSKKYNLILIDEGVENIDAKKVQWLSHAIGQVQDGLFIEISHSGKYLSKGKEVDIEEVTKSPY